jgi:hypothetical protein
LNFRDLGVKVKGDCLGELGSELANAVPIIKSACESSTYKIVTFFLASVSKESRHAVNHIVSAAFRTADKGKFLVAT